MHTKFTLTRTSRLASRFAFMAASLGVSFLNKFEIMVLLEGSNKIFVDVRLRREINNSKLPTRQSKKC
jgi:hypothetical protein